MRTLSLIFIIFLLLISSCSEAKDKDPGRYRYNKFILIPIEKVMELKLGEVTFQSIISSFGDKLFEEIIFGKYILPRKIDGKYYPVDHIIEYYGTTSTKSENDDGKNIVRRIQTKDRQTVSLFFYKERLIDYSVYHEYYINPDHSAKTALGKNATVDVRKKYEEKHGDIDAGWPERYCDEKYYYYKSGREKEFVEWYFSESCAWENPDFEVDLRKSGYYDRKNEMDRGDYSHLLKTQSMIQKW
ncbi:hypothetical protein [Leptospira santarosai]|uniref:hypothetical protein n=1 Tax=Leptospira santarosai TaxID=28183 RepID=UPI00131D3D85|nr:hypothetical protein [Leptospira santarosai]